MFAHVIAWLEHLAGSVPLPLFVTIGGMVEEIIAPVPSPLVSTLAGSIAQSQHWSIWGLLVICALDTCTKTLGATVFYVIGDKLEDLAVPRFGKWIGVGHEEVEQFGERFSGTWKDGLMLAALRAIPVMPSTPLSLACGIIKIRKRVFIAASYAGFYVRNFFFMFLAYIGIEAMESFLHGADTAETIIKMLMVTAVIVLLGYLYWRRGQRKTVSGQ